MIDCYCLVHSLQKNLTSTLMLHRMCSYLDIGRYLPHTECLLGCVCICVFALAIVCLYQFFIFDFSFMF